MNDLLPSLHDQLNQVFESIHYFMPEIYLSVLFLVVLVTDLLFGKTSAWMCRIIACIGLVLVIFKDIAQFKLIAAGPQVFFSQMLLLHPTSLIFKLIIDVLAIVLILYFEWDNELASHKKGLSDLYSIAVAAIFGMHLMLMSANLLSIYLSIEMVSIASYLMVAYHSENGRSSEAGLKYVLFGAASSAIMLYGISLLYGFSGSLSLFGGLLPGLVHANPLAVSFALVLFLAGIGFKLSFIPMHFWVPDIYQGAPAPVSAFLSTVTKIAAFGLLINFLAPFIPTAPNTPSPLAAFDFRLFLSVIGIVTMIVGNFAATLQNNIKRMLAYSSIGHTGFALMTIVTFSTQGTSALTFYLIAYALANIGAWMLASYFANTAQAENISDFKGLGFKFPLAGVCFVVILISLTGLPLTAGFYGKFLAFSSVYAVYQANHDVWLLLLMLTGALTTVVSLFYYIKVPLNLFLRKTDRITGFMSTNSYLLISIAIISLLVVYLGLFPDFFVK